MLAEHNSCDTILVQVGVLKQAVNMVATELWQAHVETCVLVRVKAVVGALSAVGLSFVLFCMGSSS